MVFRPILDTQVTEWMKRNLDTYGQIGLLVGSAISIWMPSSLPTAPVLRDSIVKALFHKNYLLTDLRAELEHQLLRGAGYSALRLETVLEEVDLHVPRTVSSFISVLKSGEPNAIHHVISIDSLRPNRCSIHHKSGRPGGTCT